MPGVKFSQFIDGGAIAAGDIVVGLRGGTNTRFDVSNAIGPNLSRNINQGAHGFVVGNILRISGSNTYAKAQANNEANSRAVGFVSDVIDANNFVLQFAGYASNPAFGPFGAGNVYYLDATLAGTVTPFAPAVVGQVVKVLLIPDTATSFYWLNYIGQQI